MEINKIYNTDCRTGLKSLPDNSVNCCVTSPPYYGLRDYETARWEGGSADCRHIVKNDGYDPGFLQKTNTGSLRTAKDVCPHCGAIRVDNQIGLENTPEAYIEKLVEVFMEIYRVLKPDGTLWINIGDSYWGGKGYSGSSAGMYQYERRKVGKSISYEYSNFGGKGTIRPTDRKHEYIKPKDLIGIPWMLAFALRSNGWYLRQEIIWHKPNPMPESVKDRCTKAHEQIFLFTKSRHYYFDHAAITESSISAPNCHGESISTYPIRNKRSVWSVCTKSEKESHFAVFPEKLIVDCIKAGCPENGLVLDPFMGSGTTAVVSRKLSRNYIGFELNPKYIEIANRKIRKHLGIFE